MTGPYLLSMQVRHDWIKSYDAYPFNLPLVKNLRSFDFHPQVTFFVGENGSGKSTLLEAIAVAYELNPEGGSRHLKFTTHDTHSQLGRYLRLVKYSISPADAYFLRAETFYNVASEMERVGGSESLHDKSHGESFMQIFAGRFGSRGLYLLDEPEAALSPQRQLQFLALLHEYCSQGSQLIIATHSPIILAYPNAAIHVLTEDGMRLTPYAETEHYKTTKNFLMNPARSLKVLLSDDEADGAPAE